MHCKDIEECLFQVLLLDGNESSMYITEEQDYIDWTRFIVALTKCAYNVRYCTIHNCQCHPEPLILKSIEMPHIKNILQSGITPNTLYDDIKTIVESVDQSQTVFGEDGNSIRRK